MKQGETETFDTDILVIGCGGAGLRAAIEARTARADVLVVSKSVSSNTAVAGGAMAAATGWRDPKDNPEAHVQDTLTGGRFINNRALVEVMALGAADEVHNLEGFGVKFMKQNDRIWMTLTTGHTYARTMMCEQRLGIGFTRPLRQYAEGTGVRFIDNLCLVSLLHRDGMVFGAAGIDKEGRTIILRARAVVLAAGGLGQIYLRTCNAAGMTGDGYVLAFEAGVPLQDMEMVQYFPTALGTYGGRQVIYDAFVARTGAPIRNSLGEDLLEKHGIKDPINMTRDRLAKAIMLEILEGHGIAGQVIIDLSMVPDDRLERMRPLLPAAVSLKDKKLAVAPTAHYCMGGVIIDTNCATNISGLYAAGEVCGGIHGANRLGSNALTEIFVFGAIAGKNAASYASKIKNLPEADKLLPPLLERVKKLATGNGGERIAELRTSLKETMWYHASIIRSQTSLEEALTKVKAIEAELLGLSAENYQEVVKAIELQNMVTVSQMVIKSALERKESRGSHYRSDYPEENDRDWLKNVVVSKGSDKMMISVRPVGVK